MVAERDAGGASRETGTGSRKKRPQRPPETHVASALRTAYEETVKESIPIEFLDLLGKLD